MAKWEPLTPVPAPDLVPFRVVVRPELARWARRLQGRRQELVCVACGRRGYVAAVQVLKPQGLRR